MALPQLQKDFRDKDTQDFLSEFKNKAKGKYNIDSHSYPAGIGNNPDLQHYVSFFINVRGKSKFNTQAGVTGTNNKILEDVKVGQGQNRIDQNKLAETGSVTTIAGAVAGAEIGGAGGILSGLSGKGGFAGAKQGIVGAAKGAVVGAGVGYAFKKLGDVNADTLKRISDVITLHIQDRPSTRYKVNYREKDLGSVAGFLAGGTSAADMSQVAAGSLTKEAAGALATSVLNTVSGKASNILELGLKQKLNPFTEQFFENVDFRSFDFKYTFMPSSEAEAAAVRRIINLFKFHMHPELSQAGLFYIYPSEFEIKYFYRDKENTYFDKISSCVLENMAVDYGGDIFSTFEDGNPVEVNLTLSFKELEIITKERITQGY